MARRYGAVLGYRGEAGGGCLRRAQACAGGEGVDRHVAGRAGAQDIEQGLVVFRFGEGQVHFGIERRVVDQGVVVALGQVVVVLHAHDPGKGLGLGHLGGGDVAQAEMADQALALEVGQHGDLLGDGTFLGAVARAHDAVVHDIQGVQAQMAEIVVDAVDQFKALRELENRYADIGKAFPEEIKGTAFPFFLDWLKYNVILVEITAYSDDNAYTIFESMNDRGLNLTSTEMLKGYLLSRFTEAKDREKANKFWRESIQTLHRQNKGGSKVLPSMAAQSIR